MSDDLISRQETIKALHDEIVKRRLYSDVDDGRLDEFDTETILRALPPAQQWIPCSERLPEDSGDYLVCPSDSVLEDYSDFSEVMIMPYDADCEAFGWWIERYDPISLGYLDSDFREFEVTDWMPLPMRLKGADDVY